MEDIRTEIEFKDNATNPFEFLAQLLAEKFLEEKKELSEVNQIELTNQKVLQTIF